MVSSGGPYRSAVRRAASPASGGQSPTIRSKVSVTADPPCPVLPIGWSYRAGYPAGADPFTPRRAGRITPAGRTGLAPGRRTLVGSDLCDGEDAKR
ncbi:hypothetical protein GCM10027575_63940 [Phytohabitans suffuscus]